MKKAITLRERERKKPLDRERGKEKASRSKEKWREKKEAIRSREEK